MRFNANLPGWERALRLGLGIGLIALGLSGAVDKLVGWAAIAAGVTAIGTALFAFCPVCAIAGRRSVP